MLMHELETRPQAPHVHIKPSKEICQDDEIITEENHPPRNPNVNFYDKFYPSFVGKTFKEMKSMEANRDTCFFTSNYLDKELQTLYNSLQRFPNSSSPYFDTCINIWRQSPSRALNLTRLTDSELCTYFTNEHLPSDIHAAIHDHWYQDTIFPDSVAKIKTLHALKCRGNSNYLFTMPHIKVLILTAPNKDFKYDFTGWTSLQILVLLDVRKKDFQIKLPTGLISLTMFQCYNSSSSFEDVFTYHGDVDHNKSVFKSLKHIHFKNTGWSTLPDISSCIYLELDKCCRLQTVEAPACQTLIVKNSYFSGFGPYTMANNNVLDTVVLYCNIFFYFPPGSPTGFRHVDLFRSTVSSLPSHFAPFAFISVIEAGSYLYIKDVRARENFAFYFDHHKLFDFHAINLLEQNLPKKDESLRDMIDRKYGFNWPKFITKIQRQFRFKKFINNQYKDIVAFLPHDICKYNVGKLLGASQTFKIPKSICYTRKRKRLYE